MADTSAALKPWEMDWSAPAAAEAAPVADAAPVEVAKPVETPAVKPWEMDWQKPATTAAEVKQPAGILGAETAPLDLAGTIKTAKDAGALGPVSNVDKGIAARALDLGAGFGNLLAATAPEYDPAHPYPYGSGDIKSELQTASKDIHQTAQDLGYKPGTTWEDVKKSPASQFIPFMAETLMVSAPDMAAVVANLPGYVAMHTGEMGKQRATNDERAEPTVEDMLKVLPAATVSALLDRLGANKMFGLDEVLAKSAKDVGKETLKAGVTESGTEMAQNVTEDLGTDLGTKKGFDPAQSAEDALQAGVAGLGGGLVRTVTAASEARKGKTVEPGNDAASEPVSQAGEDGADSPSPSSSPVSISAMERAVLRKISTPDEDIDRMSRPEIDALLQQARDSRVKVSKDEQDAAAAYAPPAAADAAPASSETAKSAAQKLLSDYAVRKQREADMNAAADQRIAEVQPALSAEVMRSVYEDQPRNQLQRPAPADLTVPPAIAAKRVLGDLRSRDEQQRAAEAAKNAQADAAVAAVTPDLERATRRSLMQPTGTESMRGPTEAAIPDNRDIARSKLQQLASRDKQAADAVAAVEPDLQNVVSENIAADNAEEANIARNLDLPLAARVQRSLYEDTPRPNGDGSRAAPVRVETPQDIQVAAERVNTEPSDAQKEAGNYQKGHMKVAGLDVTIETPKGALRTGTTAEGKPWKAKQPAHYGYVKRTTGADGDQVDVYVGPDPKSKRVYVVDQKDLKTGRFDEHKAILGANSVSEARGLYARAFSDKMGNDRIGGIKPMSASEFKKWLATADTTKPVAMGKPTVRTNDEGFPIDAKGSVKKPDSLIEFLARNGGVRDDKGELKAFDLGDRKTGFVAGAGPVLRKNGLHPDKAREAAAEAGYLPMDSTTADFYDAIDKDIRSGRESFSQYDDDWSAAWRDQRDMAAADQEARDNYQRKAPANQERDALFSTLVSDDIAGKHGDDFSKRVWQLMQAGESYENAIEYAHIEALDDLASVHPEVAALDIPFFEVSDEVQPKATPEGRKPVEQAGSEDARSEAEGKAGRVREARPSDSTPERKEPEPKHADGPQQAPSVSRPAPEPRPIASWVLRNKATGEVIAETYDKKKVDALNTDKYEAVPIGEYLASLNKPTAAAPEPSVERGADNLPQLVIPGAERASDKTMAQRAADAPMRAKVSQKDVGGLFGDEMDQGALFQISPEQAKRTNTPVAMPPDPIFSEAVGNTPGAKITKDGLLIDLVRFQKPEQSGATSVRTGVFYLPVGSPNTKHYKTGKNGYGGKVEAKGQTLIKRPMFVKGATGGKAPEAAYDAVNGKGAYQKMRGDALKVVTANKQRREEVGYNFLEEYGADGNLIYEILPASTEGNTLAYALQENVVAHAIREAGYDAMVGYSKGKEGPFISEVFDVREIDYPIPGGLGSIHPNFDTRDYSSSPAGWDVADAGESFTLTETEQKAVADIVRRVAGIDAEFKDTIPIPANHPGLLAWGRKDEASTAAGYYQPGRDAIVIALDSGNNHVAFHESFHRLQNLFLTTRDKALLHFNEQAMRKMLVGNGHGLYSEDQIQNISLKEVEAEAFAIWANNPDRARVHVGIRRIWQKIKDIADRVRNYLNGRGYQTLEDVFSRAKSGEMAQSRTANGKAQRVDPQFQPAWHGTPHKFDKFTTSKMGTGEGAQAYGWGLYFAGKKAVAEWYREKLSGSREATIDGYGLLDLIHTTGAKPNEQAPPGRALANQILPLVKKPDVKGAPDSAVRDFMPHSLKSTLIELNNQITHFPNEDVDNLLVKMSDRYRRIAEGMKNEGDKFTTLLRAEIADAIRTNNLIESERPGALYHVDVPEDHEMLDWDKPLSEQTADVRQKLEAIYEDANPNSPDYDPEERGQQIYQRLASIAAKDRFPGEGEIDVLKPGSQRVSEALARAGIPGHKYKGHESQSTNYVIYDDSRVNILNQYSIAPHIADDAQFALNPQTVARAPNHPQTIGPRISNTLAKASRAIAQRANQSGNKYDRKTADDGETTNEYFHRKFIDYLDPLKRLQDRLSTNLNDMMNPYLTARLAEGTTRHQIQQLDDKYVTPAVRELAGSGASLEDLHRFMYALHAPERNRVVGLRNEPGSQIHNAVTDPNVTGASGMSTNEARRIIRDAQQDPEKYRALQRATAHIRAMLDESLARQLRAGLISQGSYDELTQQWRNYVPLRAEIDTEDGSSSMPSKSRGFDVRGDEHKAATGRYSEADNVIVYAINQAEQSVIREEKNKVGNAALRLVNQFDPAGQNGIAEVYWSDAPQNIMNIDKAAPVYKRVLDSAGKVVSKKTNNFQMRDDVLATKIGGKTFYIRFADPKVGLAIKKMTFAELGPVLSIIKKVSNLQSLINTRANPAFIPVNVIRDVQTAGAIALAKDFSTKDAVKIMASVPRSWHALWSRARGNPGTGAWDQIVKQFAESGGKINFDQYNDIEATMKKLEKDMRINTATGIPLNPLNSKTFRAVTKFVMDLNDTLENGTRVAIFKAAMDRGDTPAKAAFLARDLTVDFQKKGENTPVANSLYTFFNASVQGNYNFAKALKDSRKVKVAAAAMIGGGVVQTLWNLAFAGDDDDGENAYVKMLHNEPYKLERNMVFFIPGTKRYIMIPMGFGMNAFWHLGAQGAAVTAGKQKVLPAMLDSARVAVDAFNPLGSGSFWSMLSPTVSDPVLDLMTNKNFAGNPIYPTENAFDSAPPPDSQQAFRNTSPVAKRTAEILNEVTGGNSIEPGMVDVHPDTLEYLWGFFTGGMGRFASQTAETAQRGINMEFEPTKTPFVRSLYGEVDENMTRTEYYNHREKVQAAKGHLKDYQDAGNEEDINRFMEDNQADIRAIGIYDTAEKQRKAINKQRRKIEASQMARAKKDDMLKALDEREMQIMRDTGKRYYQVTKD